MEKQVIISLEEYIRISENHEILTYEYENYLRKQYDSNWQSKLDELKEKLEQEDIKKAFYTQNKNNLLDTTLKQLNEAQEHEQYLKNSIQILNESIELLKQKKSFWYWIDTKIENYMLKQRAKVEERYKTTNK